MGRIARENTEVQSGRSYSCRVRDILDSEDLDDDDRAVVETRLADSRNSHRGMADWLFQYGYRISAGAVYNHRSGRCQCARDAA